MVDCLPATGGGLAIPVIALALGLLGAGVILVVRSGRHRHGPGGRRGAAAALLLASIVVVSAVVAAPAPARAAAGCAAIGDDVEITSVSSGVTYHGSYRGPAGSAMTPADAATLKAWMASGIDEIRSGTPPFPGPGPVPLTAATDFTAVMQATIAGNIFGSDPAQMVISHAYRTPYGKQFDEIGPAALAGSLKIPVLVTCGTKDVNTPTWGRPRCRTSPIR